jgi:hypothetical protein
MNRLIERIAIEKRTLQSSVGSATRPTHRPTLWRRVKEDAFVRIAAKVQMYIDHSLALRREYPSLDGLAPTELATNSDGKLIPAGILPEGREQTSGYRTAAIDQQRQLYAAARAIMIDPDYGEHIAPELIEWHDAFLRNFVTAGSRVRKELVFGPNDVIRNEPDQKVQANLRLTYAVQGSATLACALRAVANQSSDPEESSRYKANADEIGRRSLDIAEQFYEDYADPRKSGRYFLYPLGWADEPELQGLSHNNSQSYLIEGMTALCVLDAATWQPRLNELLSFIGTQRDKDTGLLREFNFSAGVFRPQAVGRSDFSWQVQNDHETVILGHTIAGLYAGPSRVIANSSDPRKKEKMTDLVERFVQTMNRIGGIHENGLLANAFQLVPGADPPFVKMYWPEGAWQVELLWQFLLNADRTGVALSDFVVDAGNRRRTLERHLERSFRFHDQNLFDGSTYVTENGKPLTGRAYAAPINHAADTLRDLASNLAET